MSKIKAKCTECGAIIEVDSGKQAEICPKCGNAIVTANAIANLNSSSSNGNQPDELSNLIDNYKAFVKLYSIDSSVLKPYAIGAQKRRAEAELQELYAQRDASAKNAEKWRNKHNSRVGTYNDAKFTAGVDSFFEKKTSQWVEKAHKEYDNAVDATREINSKISAKKSEISALQSERVSAERALFDNGAALYYNGQALAAAEEMCKKFPSHPAGYLYKADFYRREVEWRTKLFSRAIDAYASDTLMLQELKEGADEARRTDKIKAEIKKAETFMNATYSGAYGSMLAELKKYVGGTSTGTAARASSAASTSKSSSQTKKPSNRAGSSANSASRTKKTESTEEKIARYEAANRLKAKEEEKWRRKMKRRHFLIKLSVWAVILAGLAVGAYFLVKHFFL